MPFAVKKIRVPTKVPTDKQLETSVVSACAQNVKYEDGNGKRKTPNKGNIKPVESTSEPSLTANGVTDRASTTKIVSKIEAKDMQSEKSKSSTSISVPRPISLDPCKTLGFPAKLHAILSRKVYSGIISWLPHGRSWRIHKPKAFESHVIPHFFVQCKYSSFIRQANGWGFRRLTQGSDRNSYYHDYFLRGRVSLCHLMRRPRLHEKTRSDPDNEPDFYHLSALDPLPDVDEVIKPAPPTTSLADISTQVGHCVSEDERRTSSDYSQRQYERLNLLKNAAHDRMVRAHKYYQNYQAALACPPYAHTPLVPASSFRYHTSPQVMTNVPSYPRLNKTVRMPLNSLVETRGENVRVQELLALNQYLKMRIQVPVERIAK